MRLAAQRLVGEGLPDAASAVRHMSAMQGQDLPGAMTSVALRVDGRSRQDVVDAMNAGGIVRTWPMRGTLHLIPAEDLGWILSLTGERTLRATARNRELRGVDDALVDRARMTAFEALAERGALSRDELMALWTEAGVMSDGGQGYRLLFTLAVGGDVCFGPFEDGGQRIVAVADWIRTTPLPDPDEALAQWVLRYFRSHGPATVRDFAWWTKLPLSAIRAAVAEAADGLEAWAVGGTEYLMAPETPELLAGAGRAAGGTLLLPGFDEFLLGYGERGAALPDEHAGKVVPGNNGMFRGTVVSGGRVVGTWKRKGSGRAVRIDAEPFTSFAKAVATALPRRFAALP
ncbi:winged helix DNA-binding domain-containing protein [Tomitella fengzijianii]|uniref:Winged helix DNA-binding domain-containing protein n=1 Tax=Tomitella fengzijianii TaxID=2597660 RepID=A0A516X7N5_9ACTN|nr:winged helix DNA-binding domain-containing protein [Tomitella fengzijianii]